MLTLDQLDGVELSDDGTELRIGDTVRDLTTGEVTDAERRC